MGLLVQPGTGELWATNNGRDELGDDMPPETIYNVKEDTNYGWPYCYGDRVPDTVPEPARRLLREDEHARSEDAGALRTARPGVLQGEPVPAEFQGDLFVAFHGSWNRSVPTGYKLVRIRFKDNQPDQRRARMVEDFRHGLAANGDVWGRPVDPMMLPTARCCSPTTRRALSTRSTTKKTPDRNGLAS